MCDDRTIISSVETTLCSDIGGEFDLGDDE